MASVVVATSPHLPALQPGSQSQAMAGPLSSVAAAPAAAELPPASAASGEGGADVAGEHRSSSENRKTAIRKAQLLKERTFPASIYFR
jgi:hypothetical protein